MNKSEIGRSLSGIFTRHSVWTSIGCGAVPAAVISGIVAFCAGLSRLGIGPEPKASYEFVASSILCLAFTIGVAAFCFARAEILEKIVKASWLALYKGTEWRTPAGETGVVSDTDLDATHFEITFANGNKHKFPRCYLTPANENGPEADVSGLTPAGDIVWTFYSNPRMATLCTSLCWVMTAAFGWSVLNADIPYWTILPVVVSLILGTAIPLALLCSSAPFASTENLDYPLLVAKTTWKALDGRVGVVRWAKRKYEGDNVYSETILLAFPEGDEAWFRRGDLKATAFEC